MLPSELSCSGWRQLNDPQAAADNFRQVLAQNSTHYGAIFQLARTLDLMGRRVEARALWQKALTMALGYHDRETADMAQSRLTQGE